MPSPAQHQIDALAEFTPWSHPCWDRARITAEVARHQEIAEERCREIDEIEDSTLKPGDREKRKDSVRAALSAKAHPVLRYQRGATRFDLSAPGQVWSEDREPLEVVVSDYQTRCEPMVIVLRRLGRQDYAGVLRGLQPRLDVVSKSIDLSPEAATQLALTDQIMQRAAFEETCRLGVVEVRVPGQKPRKWSQSDEDLDFLHDLSPQYIQEVASAVLSLTRPLDEDEAFLYA